MIDAIIEIIKSWHGVGQFIFLFGTAFLFMIINTALVDAVSSFFNNTLPILLRGYPPSLTKKDDEAEED